MGFGNSSIYVCEIQRENHSVHFVTVYDILPWWPYAAASTAALVRTYQQSWTLSRFVIQVSFDTTWVKVLPWIPPWILRLPKVLVRRLHLLTLLTRVANWISLSRIPIEVWRMRAWAADSFAAAITVSSTITESTKALYDFKYKRDLIRLSMYLLATDFCDEQYDAVTQVPCWYFPNSKLHTVFS